MIYYGEKVWDAETSLHGILDIPAEMVPYVNDYRMLLVEARQNNLYFHNGNNQDLFNLFEILLDQNNSIRDKKEKAIEYTKEHEVSDMILKTVAGAANCKIDFAEMCIRDSTYCFSSNCLFFSICTFGSSDKKMCKYQGVI